MPVAALVPGAPMLFMGEGFTVHATSDTTGGGFLIAEIASRPGGGPRHLHAHEAAEQYLCLGGEITVITGEGVHVLGPGQQVTITPHLPHTYRNLTDSPGRLLCTLSPPFEMEGFLREICEPHDPSTPLPAVDPAVAEHAMQVAARHGMVIFDTYDPAVLVNG